MKNWLNFTKTKGTANINGTNQHKILYMELRVKFKQNEKGGNLKKTHKLRHKQPQGQQYKTHPPRK